MLAYLQRDRVHAGGSSQDGRFFPWTCLVYPLAYADIYYLDCMLCPTLWVIFLYREIRAHFLGRTIYIEEHISGHILVTITLTDIILGTKVQYNKKHIMT